MCIHLFCLLQVCLQDPQVDQLISGWWAFLSKYLSIDRSTVYLSLLGKCSIPSTIQAKTTEQDATKLSGIIKWGSRSVLHGLKSPVLKFLKRYPSISGFSFATGGHFINYCSLDFQLSGSLIRCRPTFEFKLGCRYSRFPPLLTAQILQISLGPTRCRATLRSRAPAFGGCPASYWIIDKWTDNIKLTKGLF